VNIGVNVINPMQPDWMDAAANKREFGNKLALWSTVGTACQLDWAAPDKIQTEVRRRIQELGSEGLLLAPAYDIDFAPFENIVACVKYE
jgi:uroporphyrinogen decarboxylase